MNSIEEIHSEFYQTLKSKEALSFLKGVWSVYYIEGAKKFRTLGCHLELKVRKDKLTEKTNQLLGAEIQAGFGSTGWAYSEFIKDKNKSVCYLNNTYSDPRGTVIKFDYEIGQRNTAFIAVRDDDKNVIGIIMIFGCQKRFDASKHNKVIKCIYKKFSGYFQLLIEAQRLTNVNSVFSNRVSTGSLKNILNGFLEINTHVEIPFVYILNRNSEKPDYIAFGERVLQLIEYELRFCSYLDSKPSNNCHFRKTSGCSNSAFLKEFFISVIQHLEKKRFKIQKTNYVIDFYRLPKSIYSKINIQISDFKNPFKPGTIAQEKYTNEVVIHAVGNQVQNLQGYVLCIIYRNETAAPSFTPEGCYRSGNYQETILPSNYLPYYYGAKYSDKSFPNTYPPIDDNIKINISERRVNAKLILSIHWNKNAFYELLSKHILNKDSEQISQILKLISADKDAIKCLNPETDRFTIYGISDKDIDDNPIAKSFIDYVKKDYLLLLQLQDTTLHATRAAISQVMARNMSHNIGSHVLSKLLSEEQLKQIFFKNKERYISSGLSDIESIITNHEVFYQCLNVLGNIDIEQSNGKDILSDKETNESLLSKFFHYLKVRMDYLADVTTNTPVIENSKGIYNDILKTFIGNRVLNDRISGIDNFNYEIIVCRPPANRGGFCGNHTTETCRGTDNIIGAGNDIYLSMPNDLLGSHAFYNILENIIRNTAKHSRIPISKKAEFKIKIEEASILKSRNRDARKSPIIKESENLDWDAFYAVSIFDNCDLSKATDISDWEEKKKQEAGIASSQNTLSSVLKLVIEQNGHLNTSILDNNKLRHGAWGLIEKDASAAYLRKIDVELIDTVKYDISCLQGKNPVTRGGELAILQAYAEQNKYLGYRFFIRKPQEILVIADDARLNNAIKINTNHLNNNGIWIYSDEEFKSFFDGTKQKIFPHKLVVLVNMGSTVKDLVLNNPACFSKRILYLKNIHHHNKTIKEYLWEKYLNQKKIKIYDHKKRNGIESDHGYNYCELIKANYKFIEVETSLTSHFFNQDLFVNRILFYQYSWPIKIAVIDERIQSFAKGKYKIQQRQKNKKCSCELHKDGVAYSVIYRKTNIFVPDENEANLNLQNYDSEYIKIIEYIKQRSKKHKKDDDKFGNGLDNNPCEFIVVHMGIIEKLISSYNKANVVTNYKKDDPTDISIFIKDVLLDGNIKSYDLIIITSGRGRPHNLPGDIRYLNFSMVSNYLITTRNKYAFTEALFCARKQFN